jgi:hypothetical protein
MGREKYTYENDPICMNDPNCIRMDDPRFEEEILKHPWFNLSTLEKITEFKDNPSGYDVAAPQCVVDEAIKLHEFGVSLGLKTDAFTHGQGGLDVEFFHVGSDESVDIAINPDLTYELCHEKGIGSEYETIREDESISLQEAMDYVKNWVPTPPLVEGRVVKAD